ncbi:hypothetical protein HZH66_001229 [Vespula vulgaris]|uniref:Uncharacterized protein n=1 Tax=Vespula vulgaris TaxID=7454 RepID=A0A834KSV6_VESVU|nr:hypothetical protein HZH66_001229 [Vespula vulgaris]
MENNKRRDRYFDSTVKFTWPYGRSPENQDFKGGGRRRRRGGGGGGGRGERGRRVPPRRNAITVVDFQISSEEKNGKDEKGPELESEEKKENEDEHVDEGKGEGEEEEEKKKKKKKKVGSVLSLCRKPRAPE